MIEDLLDELEGVVLFSKINLRVVYHQLRMDNNYTYKTAFKTYEGHYELLVITFSLTNAPSSFQGSMNIDFKSLPRKSVLMFFDDILIYNKTLNDHVAHVKAIFELMKQYQLYAKMSKYAFGVNKVEYLGHYISAEGVLTDPKKISVVQQWPLPSNIKKLRGFLGLVEYYRSFIQGYGAICRPLHNLLKNKGFNWSE